MGAGEPLPASLLLPDCHKVRLVLVGGEGLAWLVAANSPVRVESPHTAVGGAGLHSLQQLLGQPLVQLDSELLVTVVVGPVTGPDPLGQIASLGYSGILV